MSGKYLGPAGIWSTDNPQSDQMQIDEESFVDPQDELNDYYASLGYFPDDEEFPDEEDVNSYGGQEYTIHSVFACLAPQDINDPWWDQENFFESEKDAVIAKMQKKHDEHCNCGNNIVFS